MNDDGKSSRSLKRTFGVVTLIAFGVGDILGAGIYGLIGKVAGFVGYACWSSFAVACVVAGLTGLSYAELGSRFPRSGGEAYFAQRGFRSPFLSYLVGFLVLASGVFSISAVSHIFTGYLREGFLPDLAPWLMIVGFLVLLTLITLWGIRQSSAVNIICTLVEVSGLMIVLLVGLRYFGCVDYFDFTSPDPEAGGSTLPIVFIFQGGVLAFYAFIGFEDMVNVAEEVKNPEKLLPRAILVAMIVMAVLYGLIAIAAVSVVPPAELARSDAPLRLVVKTAAPGFPIYVFNIIALFAVTNTALVNFVMGSRLLYGMANQGLVPSVVGTVGVRLRTPHIAILIILAITIVLALTGSVTILAGRTSLVLLVVFFIINLSLVAVKLRADGGEPSGSFHVPVIIPILGALTTLGLACFVNKEAFVVVACVVALGAVVYVLMGRRR